VNESLSTPVTNLNVLEQQWKKLSGRDIQLWSIGLLVMMVMAIGALSQVAPAWFQGQTRLKMDLQYVPALALGLIALVLLLNFYLIGQRRALDLVRYDLIREMALNHALQQVATIDAETQLFARAALSNLMTTEISRANRFGTELSLLFLQCDNFDSLRRQKTPFTADQMLVEAANLLRRTFRGSDIIVRFSKTEFLVLLPQTSLAQSARAMARVGEALDAWNMGSKFDFELSLQYGASLVQCGEPSDAAIQRAQRNLHSLGGGTQVISGEEIPAPVAATLVEVE
jgi:diguanylate cyclase (GGDEF)-like protein